MPKNLTIQRYDGSTNGWEELYPKTTKEQVVGLVSDLAGKQTKLTVNGSEVTAVDTVATQNSNNLITSNAVYNVLQVANGATNTYSTTLFEGDNFYEFSSQEPINYGFNSLFVGTTNYPANTGIYDNNVSLTDIQIHSNDVFITYAQLSGATYIYLVDQETTPGSNDNDIYTYKIRKSVAISSLKAGDALYITQTDVPDFWWTGAYFSKLETSKVVLDNYLTAVSYDGTSHKIKYTKKSGDTDVVDLDNFASISNGVISIGGNSITPVTSHQTMKYREIKVDGTQKISDTATTALDFKNDHSVNYVYDGGLHSYVATQTSPSGGNLTVGEIAFIIPASNS